MMKEWRASSTSDIFKYSSGKYLNQKFTSILEGKEFQRSKRIDFIAGERKSMQLFLIQRIRKKENEQRKGKHLFWQRASREVRLNKKEEDQTVRSEVQNALENFSISAAV